MGADFRAVLFFLPALLGQLVGVEIAFDPVDRAVEEIDRRPEEIVEIGFEAGLRQRRNEGVEDVGDGAGARVGVREAGEGRVRRQRDDSRRAGAR